MDLKKKKSVKVLFENKMQQSNNSNTTQFQQAQCVVSSHLCWLIYSFKTENQYVQSRLELPREEKNIPAVMKIKMPFVSSDD